MSELINNKRILYIIIYYIYKPRVKVPSAPNGTVMCQVHRVSEMVTPAMKMTAVLLVFQNLTNHAMFSFVMTRGLA